MSQPGSLTDAELVDVGDGFRLRINAGARWLAAKAELTEAFGFAPILTSIPGYPHSGAYRTQADQAGINPAVSYLYSEHCEGLAVDIDNQERFRDKDNDLFVAILEKHGITFHVALERWHGTIASTAPADSSSTPFDNTTRKDYLMNDAPVFQMTDDQGTRLNDWSRIADTVLPIGTFPGGYEATSDPNIARIWINNSGQSLTGPTPLPRKPYIAQQQWGASQYKLRRADDIARIKEALAG